MEESVGIDSSAGESFEQSEQTETNGNVLEQSDMNEVDPQQNVDTHSLTVNGEEKKLSYDELVVAAQKGLAATQKFQKASELEKVNNQKLADMERMFGYIKESPIEALKHLGVDFDEIAESHLIKKTEYEMMDENERRYHDLEREAQRKDQELQRYRQMEEQNAHNARVENYQSTITNELKANGFEGSPREVAEVASELSFLMEHNPNAQVKDAVSSLSSKRQNLTQGALSSLPVEEIIKMFGPEKMKQIRQAEIAKLKSNDNQFVDLSDKKVVNYKKKQPKLTKSDWKEWLHSQY